MARWPLAKQAKLNLYHFSFYKDNIVIWRYCAEINSYFGATFLKLHFASVSKVITLAWLVDRMLLNLILYFFKFYV